jgi:hypothetical protein
VLNLRQVIVGLQEQSKAKGYLTIDELGAALPVDLVTADDIESVMAELKRLGVLVVEHD